VVSAQDSIQADKSSCGGCASWQTHRSTVQDVPASRCHSRSSQQPLNSRPRFCALIRRFRELRPLEYRDDAAGGVHADCAAELELPSEVPCFVELSRTRNLRKSAIIEGSRRRLEVLFYADRLELFMMGYGIRFDCLPQSSALQPGACKWS
jgi:hypothetical protein